MHIKRMHEMIEKLTKCAEMELEKGIDKIDAEEMGEVTDMIKDLAEAEYYSKISKAMDESEYGEDYDYMGAYDEHERKGYRGQRRDSRGRYMSRKRGYMPDMMMYDEDWEEMQRNRDMDREHGKMYYTEPMHKDHSQTESRYDRARRGYEETKSMHNGNTSEDKQHKMKSLEEYTKELAEDITGMVHDMSAEEKNLLRSKLQMLAQKV